MESERTGLNPESSKRSSAAFRTLLFAGRIVIGGALLYFVLRMVSVEKIGDAIRSASLLPLLFGSVLLVFNLALRVMKWRYMLHIVKDESSWWESLTSVLLGITLGSFTPGQIGELGGRSVRVNHSRASHVVGLTLVDRTQVFLVIAMAGTFAYSFFVLVDPLRAAIAGTGCALICLYCYFRLDLVATIADKINWKIFRHHWLDGIIESFTFVGRQHILSTLLYSVAYYAVLTLQMYFFVQAFVSISLWDVFLGFSAMMLFKSLINISISDIGVREASTVYFFSLLGVHEASALSASVLMFTVNIIIPSLVGVVFIPRLRRRSDHHQPESSTGGTTS